MTITPTDLRELLQLVSVKVDTVKQSEHNYNAIKAMNRAANRIEQLEAALKTCLPVVEAAYWDEYSAGAIPGSGYNRKAQTLAGRIWGWRTPSVFEAWLKSISGPE